MKATTVQLLPNPKTIKDSITTVMAYTETGTKTRSTTMTTLEMLKDLNKINNLKKQDLNPPSLSQITSHLLNLNLNQSTILQVTLLLNLKIHLHQ